MTALEKAVRAWQLYHGSFEHVTIRDQQRLYDRARRFTQAVAKSYKLNYRDALEQLTGEARKRGSVRPQLGRDL